MASVREKINKAENKIKNATSYAKKSGLTRGDIISLLESELSLIISDDDYWEGL